MPAGARRISDGVPHCKIRPRSRTTRCPGGLVRNPRTPRWSMPPGRAHRAATDSCTRARAIIRLVGIGSERGPGGASAFAPRASRRLRRPCQTSTCGTATAMREPTPDPGQWLRGVLEPPEASPAWTGLRTPHATESRRVVVTAWQGGVDVLRGKGHYGHRSRKTTGWYAVGGELPGSGGSAPRHPPRAEPAGSAGPARAPPGENLRCPST